MRLSFAMLGLAAAIAAPGAADAQAQRSGTRFGVEAAYADHFNLGVGAFVKFHLTDLSEHPITGRASFDYYFPGHSCSDDGDVCISQHYWQLSADALYDIANPKSDTKPYVGAGLEYARFSYGDGVACIGDCGGIALNILGGINFMGNSGLMPFVEIKLGLAGSVGTYGGTVLTIKGGIHLK